MKIHSVAQACITDAAAHNAVEAAVQEARRLGLRINVAVTDPSGTLMAFLRMPGAFVHSVEIAIDKARTAAGFGFATSKWKDIVGGDALLAAGLNKQPGLAMFGGGLPIDEDGQRIGGIGVSGGSAEQDEQCAAAGLAALKPT
jgi:uncharacterized protein GlcG (DUF336 family)